MVTLEGLPYPASGSFDTDGSIIEIDFEKFKKEFFNNPTVALSFFKSLSRKIKNLESVISLNIVFRLYREISKIHLRKRRSIADETCSNCTTFTYDT